MNGDGLSQNDRLQRLNALDAFTPLDSRMPTLLKQAEYIASFIRYYNLNSQHDGYFDTFLNQIKTLQHRKIEDIDFDGFMEPSQAILFTFLSNLKEIIETVNQKWKEQYVSWYMDHILGIQSKPLVSDHTWIQLKSNTDEDVLVEKDSRFTFSGSSVAGKICYNLIEDIQINTINIAKTYTIYLEKSKDVFPANLFNIPIALHKQDFISAINCPLFGKRHEQKTIEPIGLYITSPSFLLSEGRRKVVLYIFPETQEVISIAQKRKIVHLLQTKKKWLKKERQKKGLDPHLSRKDTTNIKKEALFKVLNTIFYLKVSTINGWEMISNYNVKYEKEYLKIQFLLDENFPSLTICSEEIHGSTTKYPGLKIHLNHDAWLYPYAWLKDFYIKKITIDTQVENISNILFYNDLGEVDILSPFSPFGINKEQGAWFVIGNYEMAKKKLKSMDLNFEWHQLPQCTNGLSEYYHNYKMNINNLSFNIRPQYLCEYKWNDVENTEPLPLFATLQKDAEGKSEALGRLATESSLQNIRIGNMHPVQCSIDNYEYNIQSKTGFFKFILESPEIGFGEKYYRQLYTRLLMSKKFRKNRKITLNEPLNPLISKITVSYQASDEIDLRTYSKKQESRLYHIYPLGEQLVYPKSDNKPIPFVYNLDADTSFVFGLGLENVKGDEVLNLYFEFSPIKEEVSLSDLPIIIWSWGDGYHWENLPDESILRNSTKNFLTDGILKIYIPPIPEKGFRDTDGLVWISANIVKNEQHIAPLLRIYNNAVKVVKDSSLQSLKISDDFIVDESEKEIPGITEIIQIAPFKGGQELETEVQKKLRISEYITHRQRAITARDYERIALEVFPEIEKIKCIYDNIEKKVALVIIPKSLLKHPDELPKPLPELLLKIEEYFSSYTSATVRMVDAISPLYEDIIIRCEVITNWTNYSNATSRAIMAKAMNQIIAPWQNKKETPCLDYSFTVQEIYDKISNLNQVEEIKQLSAIHIYQNKVGEYLYKEYTNRHDKIQPSTPYSILVPHKEHLFISEQNSYGIDEMKINETFIIWHDETERL